jgi:hypothetical protein
MAEEDDFLQKSVTAKEIPGVSNGAVINFIVPYYAGYDRIALPPVPPPYWSYSRDAVLRATVHHEAMWAGAIGIAITKVASQAFNIKTKHPRKAKEAQQLLIGADGSRVGWVGFISKTLRDFLCLSGEARIKMGGDRIGQTKSIRDIVQERDPGPVLSVDSNGRIVERPINNWFKNPLGDRKWWWISLENSNHGRTNPGGIFATDNHPFLTTDGWVEAKDITPGMMVATGDFDPSEEQAQLMTGTMLGDASMSMIKKRAVLRFGHCLAQEVWLQYKQEILSGFQWTGYKVNPNTRGYGKGHSVSVTVNSRGSTALIPWYQAWYPEGKKIVPREYIQKYFSPRMMAAWFCDDGSFLTHKTRAGNFTTPTMNLYTNGFTVDDVEWLANFLSEKGFPCHLTMMGMKNGKKYPVIYVTAEGTRRLVQYMGSYIPDPMRYKLPKDAPAYDESTKFVNPASAAYDKVVYSCQKNPTTGISYQKTTFNIGVEETENFIAANMVVHNCTDNGAFIEIIRETKSIGSKIIGLRHLDSIRCQRTGNPDIPVIYRSRDGRLHEMKDYQIIMFADMPDPGETYYGVGLSAASRAYFAIYKLATIEWYLREKVGGLHPLAIHIVNGVLDKQISGAVEAVKSDQVSRGITAYMGAVIVGVPQDQQPSLVSIPLAEIPDRFNRKEEFDIAVLTYANAIGLDIQELQPLSGQGLSGGTQSTVLADKAQGKGLVAFRQAFTHALNHYVLPDGVEFEWTEKDYRDIDQQIKISKQRADVAGVRIDKGITTAQQEMQIMIDADELPKEFQTTAHTAEENLSDTEDPDDEVDTELQRQSQTTTPATMAPPASTVPATQKLDIQDVIDKVTVKPRSTAKEAKGRPTDDIDTLLRSQLAAARKLAIKSKAIATVHNDQ